MEAGGNGSAPAFSIERTRSPAMILVIRIWGPFFLADDEAFPATFNEENGRFTGLHHDLPDDRLCDSNNIDTDKVCIARELDPRTKVRGLVRGI